MKVAFCLWIAVSLAVCGCAPRNGVSIPVAVVEGNVMVEPPLWQKLDGFGESCTAVEAERWEEQALNDPHALLPGAACLISLAEDATTGPDRLDASERSRQLAAAATERWPQSAAAHYLLAYATGLVAEQRPLQALKLVPQIEGEAQLAAELDGSIDHGGPDRMLAELYLQAPGFPISLGDSALAVEHYRKAVALAPTSTNRLGLIEALLAEEKLATACSELSELLHQMVPETAKDDWTRAVALQKRLCSELADR